MAYLLVTLRLVLGSTLLIAAMGKLFAIDHTVDGLTTYLRHVLPMRVSALRVRVLAGYELGLGLLLVLGWGLTAASVLAVATVVPFFIVSAHHLARSESSRCACFGRWVPSDGGAVDSIRNAALLAIALAIAVGQRGASPIFAVDGYLSGRAASWPPWTDLVPVLMLAAAGIVVVMAVGAVSVFHARTVNRPPGDSEF